MVDLAKTMISMFLHDLFSSFINDEVLQHQFLTLKNNGKNPTEKQKKAFKKSLFIIYDHIKYTPYTIFDTYFWTTLQTQHPQYYDLIRQFLQDVVSWKLKCYVHEENFTFTTYQPTYDWLKLMKDDEASFIKSNIRYTPDLTPKEVESQIKLAPPDLSDGIPIVEKIDTVTLDNNALIKPEGWE